MRTPFSQTNQAFSNAAHEAAKSLVYPELFNCDPCDITFDTTSVADGGQNAILDGQMAVDRLVHVTAKKLSGKITHTIQERFRRERYSSFRDITITEYNHASGQQSELYKIKSGIFVYGYFFPDREQFGEVIAVDVSRLLMAISEERIRFKKEDNRRSQQTFITLKFDDLHDSNVVVWHRGTIAVEGQYAKKPMTPRRDPSRPSSRQTMFAFDRQTP